MKIILITILVLSNIQLSALQDNKNDSKQNNENYEWLDNRVGFTYSMMTGHGLTYFRQLNEKFALKSQLFAYGTIEETSNRLDLMFLLGTELQYNVRRFERTRLYVLAGGFYGLVKEQDNNVYRENEYYQSIDKSINVGLGLGFEILFKYNLSFSLDGGYYVNFADIQGYETIYESGEKYTIIPKNTKPIRFGFGFGASIFYNF